MLNVLAIILIVKAQRGRGINYLSFEVAGNFDEAIYKASARVPHHYV